MRALAFVLWFCGTCALFRLNHDRSARASKAIWLPVLWVTIVASRPVSVWLGLGPAVGGLDATLEGDSRDAAIFLALLMAGLFVLTRRRQQLSEFYSANRPLVIYFAFCLLSVLWSPIPGPSFKRWIKAVGDLVMVLVVATDQRPIVALQRFFSHIGFLLLPASVLLIRYTDIGRGYDPDGNPMNTGVTTNKNMLGVLVMVVGLAALWQVCLLIRDRTRARRRSQLVAQLALLMFAVALLLMAHSATSLACFLVGASVILAAGFPAIRRRPALMHKLILGVSLIGGLGILTGADEFVLELLGRDSNLTGRTDIWKAVIPMSRDPIIGVGFESFWNASAETLRGFSQSHMFANLNSAHNGYLEVYLNLGIVGLGLIGVVWVGAYRAVGRYFRRDPDVGSLLVSYVSVIPLFSISEAGFRLFNPLWIGFLLAYVLAGQLLGIGRWPVGLPNESTGFTAPRAG